MYMLLFLGLGVVALALGRLWSILPHRVRGFKVTSNRSKARQYPFRTLIVLGSGGHTTEMLKLIKRLSTQKYAPISFVVAATDHTSQEKAMHERQVCVP
jgi:hypothetical protein